MAEQLRLSNLYYHGWLARASLRALMDACDALILPSHVESFGTVALEAMARQRVVLISSTSGLAEWPELAASVVVLHEDESLFAAIDRLRRIEEWKRMKIGHAARKAALEMNARAVAGWKSLIEASIDATLHEIQEARAAVRSGSIP